MSDFIHLHNHTDYSLLDAAQSVDMMLNRVDDLNMSSIAVTEHGNLFSLIPFYKEARKAGVKPILGCEVYVSAGKHTEKTYNQGNNKWGYYHLVLLAQNNTGYKNLLQLITKANVEGFYYKPRIDKELLEEHKEGLIILSGCPQGDIPRLLIDGNYEEAKEVSEWFQGTFENFYLEIQRHEGIPLLEPLNAGLLKLNQELGIF